MSIDDIEGVVVFSSISASYSNEFPKANWSDADNDGIMILQENDALVFHDREYLLSENCKIEILDGRFAEGEI